MCDKDSCSLTPPHSPLLLQMDDVLEPSPPKISRRLSDDDLVPDLPATLYFTCGGDVHGVCKSDLHGNSLLRKGAIKLGREAIPSTGCDVAVGTEELFQCQFVMPLSLLNNMQQLFMFAKSHISAVQRGSESSHDNGLVGLRTEIKAFLDYIKEFLLKHIPTDSIEKEEFLISLVSELHGMLLYAGRLSDAFQFTPQSSASMGRKLDSGHHHFHLQLDIYWSVLDILHTVYTHFSGLSVRQQLLGCAGDAMLDLGYLDQLIQLVMWDLVAAARLKYNKVALSCDYVKVSPFTCTCVEDMWVFLIHLATHRNKTLGEESFWIRFYRIIQEVCEERDDQDNITEFDSDVFVPGAGCRSNNPTGFSLWLILHVAHLFQIDDGGRFKPLEPTHSNYFILKNILQKKISTPTLTESELRVYLYCCVNLAQLWEPETSLLVLLWDHFYRKLNSNFQVASTSLEGLAQVSKSPESLLRQIKKWCSSGEISDKETSYQLFLKLLATQLSRLMRCGCVQEWRQMKGRFISKFHQRRIQELSEIGLYNFTCLFLILAYTTELPDMGKKLCDFYNMLDPSNTSLNRRTVTWIGGLTLACMCTEKATDMTFVAEKLSASFNAVCREFSSPDLDPQRRHSLWKMLSLYMDALQDIFEKSPGLSNSEHKLLGEDLTTVFRVCRDGEMRYIFTSLQAIVNKFRSVTKCEAATSKITEEGHLSIALYLWLYVYPFVRDHATTNTPPLSLADLASDFCLMAKEQSAAIPTREDFMSVFQHFAIKETVPPSISCHFLCQVLSEEGIMDYIISTNQSSQSQLLQAWFRCVILLPASSPQLCTITSIAVGLPIIKKVFDSSATEIPSEGVPKLFLQALGKQYSNTQDLREKMLVRDEVMDYFSPVPHLISPVLRTMTPEDSVNTMYTSVGHLVKYCAPMLFAQTRQDSPLPLIISSMLIRDKQVSPVFLSAVRNNLHLFVQGLGKLDFKRAPFVTRRLGDIVSLYLTRFPMKTSGSMVSMVHPLVSCLCGSYVQSPSSEALDLRHLLLEIVHTKFLQLKNFAVPPSASVGLAYITEVLQRTKDGEVIARDSKLLLQTVMEYMLLCSQPAMKHHAASVSKHLLEACNLHPAALPESELLAILRRFLNTYLKLHSESVLQIFEKLGVISPDVIGRLVLDMTSAVREMERKRGVGVDKVLRKNYMSVLSVLGEKGEGEIHRLQTEQL